MSRIFLIDSDNVFLPLMKSNAEKKMNTRGEQLFMIGVNK